MEEVKMPNKVRKRMPGGKEADRLARVEEEPKQAGSKPWKRTRVPTALAPHGLEVSK